MYTIAPFEVVNRPLDHVDLNTVANFEIVVRLSGSLTQLVSY